MSKAPKVPTEFLVWLGEQQAAAHDRGWNEAIDAGIAAILNRCCSHMAKLGHCHHQPCDYYQNAMTELRALKRAA